MAVIPKTVLWNDLSFQKKFGSAHETHHSVWNNGPFLEHQRKSQFGPRTIFKWRNYLRLRVGRMAIIQKTVLWNELSFQKQFGSAHETHHGG